MSKSLEEERDELRRDLRGTQEMLAHVLVAVGEPVEVTKAQLDAKLPEGTQIAIDDNVELGSFFFYVEFPND